jgi:histidinol-phosphate aminotransferase
MKPLVPDYIANAALYPPGMPLDELKRTYGLERIVKLNANENPLGPSPASVRAVRDAAAGVHRYPDNSAYHVRQKLANRYGLPNESIILGNGSNELVQFIIMTFMRPGESVVTAKPTFSLYAIMSGVLGGRVIEAPLASWAYDLDAMAGLIADDTKVVFISNPNNPTGTIVTKDSFNRFMERVPPGVVVVVDEAYAEFVTSPSYPDTREWIRRDRNIIVLRTFSKAYGLAGVRLGYGLGPKRLTCYLERLREPFNANELAQKAACAALDDTAHMKAVLDNNREGRQYLCRAFDEMSLAYIPTEANFVLVHVGPHAKAVHDRLLARGVMVRYMNVEGLTGYLRITVGLPEENRIFVNELCSAISENT